MKKINVLVILMMCLAGSILAQVPVKQTQKLDDVQVPVAVKKAFEANFGDIPDGGYWMVHVVRIQDADKTVTTPQWYSFNKRTRPERMEARFSPEGELLSSRGLAGKLNGPENDADDKKKIG